MIFRRIIWHSYSKLTIVMSSLKEYLISYTKSDNVGRNNISFFYLWKPNKSLLMRNYQTCLQDIFQKDLLVISWGY
jgi:hypothetical protein